MPHKDLNRKRGEVFKREIRLSKGKRALLIGTSKKNVFILRKLKKRFT